jgi:hypothetical protein
MKTKVSSLLLLCSALFLSSVNAAGIKSAAPAKAKAVARVAPFASCVGVPQFFYGFTYFPGQRVVYGGQLYQAIQTNSGQWPGFGGGYWAWFGPCN